MPLVIAHLEHADPTPCDTYDDGKTLDGETFCDVCLWNKHLHREYVFASGIYQEGE